MFGFSRHRYVTSRLSNGDFSIIPIKIKKKRPGNLATNGRDAFSDRHADEGYCCAVELKLKTEITL